MAQSRESSRDFWYLTRNSIKDVIHLDGEEYINRIGGYTDEHLLRQEIVKTQQLAGSCFTGCTGFALMSVTGGFSLLLTAYAVRRSYKAVKKLKMIKAEVLRRGYETHTCGCADVMIPLCAGMLGACLAPCCVEVCVGAGPAMVAAVAIPPDVVASHATDAVTGFVGGVGGTIAQEIAYVTHLGTTDGVVGAAAAQHLPIADAAYQAHSFGYNAGTQMIVFGEKVAANVGVTHAADKIMNRKLQE